MPPRITLKERAAFVPANHKRITDIVKAGKDPKQLKEIPPAQIMMDITYMCNYDCIGCIDGGVVGRQELVKGGQKWNLDWAIIQKLLAYAKNNNLLGFMIQGGEPLSYPKINDFLLNCAENNLALRLVTNGSQILLNHAEALIAAFKHPKSTVRVSINADEANYAGFTTRGRESKWKDMLDGIETIVKGGAKVITTTVAFGADFSEFSNINQAENIVRSVMSAGVDHHIFLPGRNPYTKETIPLTENEIQKLKYLCLSWIEKGKTVELGGRFSTEIENPGSTQNKDYAPCPTGLLRTVVGSDGTLYMCGERKGESSAIMGKIPASGEFASVWHSEERASRQIDFNPLIHCKGITCDRYGINASVETARMGWEKFKSESVIAHILLESEEAVTPEGETVAPFIG